MDFAADFAAEFVAEPVALLNDHFRMRLCLRNSFLFCKGFLYLLALFNCSELLLPASLASASLPPTINAPPLARLFVGLYRATLYTGLVAAAASHSLSVPERRLITLSSFRCLTRRCNLT